MNYYAVRYKSAPNQIRIEKAAMPRFAFRRAFGCLPSDHAEYKDLGRHVSIMKNNTKRGAMLKDPKDWITFEAPRTPAKPTTSEAA